MTGSSRHGTVLVFLVFSGSGEFWRCVIELTFSARGLGLDVHVLMLLSFALSQNNILESSVVRTRDIYTMDTANRHTRDRSLPFNGFRGHFLISVPSMSNLLFAPPANIGGVGKCRGAEYVQFR